MQSKTKKRIAGAAALLSVAAILLSGTFAWQDFRQHTVNVFETDNNPNVTLNDEYTPPASWDITVNSVVDKKVSVTNTENSSAPVFVRIQFSEFMESYKKNANSFIMDANNPTVPVLFATWASGDHIGEYLVWNTEKEARDGLAALGLALPPYAVNDDNDAATPDKWYARTVNEELKNGVYGKPMQDPTNPRAKTRAHLFGAVERVPLNQDIQTTPFAYKPHTWDGNSINDSSTAPFYSPITDNAANTISDYILWEMGNDVISYAQWEKEGKTAQNKWVLAEDGWCYWGTFLPINTTTSNLMEDVRLISVPNDGMDYEIHVDMQAITSEEMETRNEEDTAYTVWPEMSRDMRDSLRNTLPAMKARQLLQGLIDYLRSLKAEDYTPDSWAAMMLQLEKAEILAADPQAKYDDLTAQVTALSGAKTALVKKADKTSLSTLVKQVEALKEANYTVGSWSTLQENLTKAKLVLNNTNATQTQVNTAYTGLAKAKDGLAIVNDKGALKDAITIALTYQQADWSSTTWTPFNAALTSAITVRDNSSATAAQVQSALETLENARLALRADKAALQTLINQVKAFNNSAIPAANWEAVAAALEAANKVNDAATSKQSEVQAAISKLGMHFAAVRGKGTTFAMFNGERWRVLDVQAGKMMVLSENLLYNGPFDTPPYKTWGASAARATINADAFLNAHFSKEEQTQILTTDVQTPTAYNNATLLTTQDKLFLLSATEATTLMTQAERVMGNAIWYLRTPVLGSNNGADYAQTIGSTGLVAYTSVRDNYAIRPAMWITLPS